MTTPIINDSNKVNFCCPNLRVLECSETKEHCHLVCIFSDTSISNKTARDLCIGENFKEYVNLILEAS